MFIKTMSDNNNIVHNYLIPLLYEIDFNECNNNTAIKTVMAKLITIASKSMKAKNELMIYPFWIVSILHLCL